MFSAVINRLETILRYPCAPLQIAKLTAQPKSVSGSCYPIKWDHVVSSNDVEEDGISEIIRSTSRTKPSNSGPSIFRISTRFSKLNTDDQGVQLPPTNSPPLTYFHGSRYQSWQGNLLHLRKTTSSWQFFPWFINILQRTNSWWVENNAVKCGYVWRYNSSILYCYKFMFFSLIAHEELKMKNPIWLPMIVEVMSFLFFMDMFIWIMFNFLAGVIKSTFFCVQIHTS